jgi:TRAP-type C4-dicarboxylate transport system permease small subunit
VRNTGNSSSNLSQSEQSKNTIAVNRPPLGRIVFLLGKGFSTIESGMAFIGSGSVITFMMFYIIADIIARAIFNQPFLEVMDLVGLCMVVAVFGAISIVQREERHIRMDAITHKLSGRRTGDILECVILLIMLGTSAILFYSTGRYTFLDGLQNGYVTNTVRFPTWPAALFLGIGYLLISIRILIGLNQRIRIIIAGAYQKVAKRELSATDD